MTTALNDCQRGFCRICYGEAVARLCAGFTVIRPGGKSAVAVPPLRADMALYVRRAAAVHLASHGTGDTARHPGHARSWK
jgi:predicted SAM-dependent methyltransferase